MDGIAKKYFIYFLSLLLNQWLMISSETEFNLTYSSIFVLLDKTIVDVAQDGIHFFDAQLNNENTSHFVQFTVPLENKETSSRISFDQFSQEYDEYILILCRRIIYIFDKQHNLKSNFSLDESIQEINDKSKYIIAYKKIDESLHYLIRYSDYTSHYIQHYKFNLNSLNVENIVENPIDRIVINDGIYPNSAYCSFMSYTDINHDILSCFYVCRQTNIILMNTVSYDPEKNFNEIDSLRYNITINFWNGETIYFEGKTNEEKDKVLFYFYQEDYFWGTFDYTNHFSDFVPIDGTRNLVYNYFGHKLLYFRDTKEFIAFSSFNLKCTKFIMVFHYNLTIKYKGILDNGIHCWDIGPNNIFYNGNNYTIIYEDIRDRSNGNSYSAVKVPINELSLAPLEPSNPSTS